MFDIVKLKNREIRQENGEQFGNMAEAAFLNLNADTSDISEQWAKYQRFLSS